LVVLHLHPAFEPQLAASLIWPQDDDAEVPLWWHTRLLAAHTHPALASRRQLDSSLLCLQDVLPGCACTSCEHVAITVNNSRARSCQLPQREHVVTLIMVWEAFSLEPFGQG
jgi:hypothetical protein